MFSLTERSYTVPLRGFVVDSPPNNHTKRRLRDESLAKTAAEALAATATTATTAAAAEEIIASSRSEMSVVINAIGTEDDLIVAASHVARGMSLIAFTAAIIRRQSRFVRRVQLRRRLVCNDKARSDVWRI